EFLLNQKQPPFRVLDSTIFTPKKHPYFRFSSSRAAASNSSHNSFHAPDSVLKSFNALDSAQVKQQPPILTEEFPCFRLSCSIVTHTQVPSKKVSIFQIQFQLNNSLQNNVDQNKKTYLVSLLCISSRATSSSSLQESVYTPNYASVEQQPPIPSTTASMLRIQLNNSVQFATESPPFKESLPVSFSLSPLQKCSYASDSAPVDQQLPTLTKEHPCFRLNCSIVTSLSSLQRSFNASDSVPVEQQPPK
uniref:Uncharacterized protein n=1 Tax=Strongyloides stercoralis TaxID=6248 RepID=A0AAF5CZ86_STRER